MKTIYIVNAKIPVSVEKGSEGLFYATSPIVPGLLATGQSEKSARDSAETALLDLLTAAYR